MLRTLTVIFSTLLIATCAAENTNNEQTILGVFRRVHIVSQATIPEPNLIVESDSAVLQNFTKVNTKKIKSEVINRIVGGRQVSIYEVPWQAALIQDKTFVCGASIISTIWVLTAGHCVFGFGNSSFVVRGGSDSFRTGGQARRVGFMAVHGQYNPNKSLFDLAMLKVTRRFSFGLGVQPIRIPTQNSRLPSSFLVTGWGTTSETSTSPTRRLRGARVNLINRRTCARQYANTIYNINANFICAAASGRDACQGDSGGALTNDGVQFGIVSFGIGCAEAQFSGVYTNVVKMAPWILSVARTFSRTHPSEEDGSQNFKLVEF